MLDNIGDNSKYLELVSADLLDADSIDKACEDCDLVVHVASPFVMNDPKDENDVLGPAINGTENVINACFKNNVKRVVVTSSCISILDWNNLNEADETQWAPIDGSTPVYNKSKILAEKKAWEMVKNPPDGKKLELVTILPGFVVGRPLYKASGASIDTVSGILTGKIPRLPCVYFPMVDVEDVSNWSLYSSFSTFLGGSGTLVGSNCPDR